MRPADRYGSGEEGRTWIKPVYDTEDPDLVVDIEGTWEEFWTYCYGSNQIDPSIELNWQYDKPLTCPGLLENGVLPAAESSYANLSSASFGKANDYAAVLSSVGQDWIQNSRDPAITVSREYVDLIELQGRSVNPLYFVTDAEAGNSDICDYWFMRSGATDLVAPPPIFFALATALQNQGKNVDAALMWDEMHQVTSDQDAFFAYAYNAIEEATEAEETISLDFDADAAYQGEYTVSDNEYFPGTIVFKTYQATYVTEPITGKTWGGSPSEDYFKLNIKVPVSYNGEVFDQEAMADAPILFYNPWGGDRGYPVGDPSALAARGNTAALVGRALSEGWVVVEPGMRGAANCFVGTPDEEGYYNYGKLPYPIADLKAAIRYLRYGENAETIPGDKERIFVAGGSSGGSATVMLGSSGNSAFFEPYLEEMGAADARDDVYAVFPSCPVMIRSWGDPAIAWERWGDLSGNEEANEINVALTQAFVEYQAGLGIRAEFDVGDSIQEGDLLTADNYAEYLMVYVKESAIKFLNGLGGKEAIDEYLATELPANGMYGTPAAARDWIKPVYDTEDPDLVVDIEGTWEEFWAYVVGEEHFNPANLLDMQYDRPLKATDEMSEGNGVVNSLVGDRNSQYANASSFSFGKAEDYAAVFSDFGQDWIQNHREPPITISEEYLELIELQRNSVDPLYFVIGEGAEGATVCENWFMRTGSVDLVTPHPSFFNLATALENQGKNVDAALVWDQGHGLSRDLDGFFAFADELLDDAQTDETISLDFDADAAYQGEYTVSDNEYFPGTIVFKTYQATYVTEPITGKTWGGSPSEDYFKLNIKVPVSYNGEVFDQEAMADAPILFYNPWGGDRGYPVGDPSALAARGNTAALVGRALSEGWVVVEPGMRGAANCFVGTPDEEGYYNYGKLPYPIADLKAAIRYLRYGENAETIPGDKERIFVAGGSSGGSATVMLGSSGNSAFFEPYLEEMGAADARDDVYAVFPSCPVMIRSWGDPAIAWERWGDLSGNEEANEINVALTQAFVEYQAGLGIRAEFDVGDSIQEGDLLTADNYAEYLMVYVKESAIKFLNGLGGKEAIDEYLATELPANGMYGTPAAARDWIKPVYDTEDPDLVVDIEGTWEEFWAYVVGEEHFNPANLLDMQYDRPLKATDEMSEGNGVVNSLVGDRNSQYANASSFSFGKAEDYAAVFSDFGQDWIQNHREPPITISEEYLELIELQRNSVDPLYFVIGEGAEGATVCENWFMRTGSVDLVTPHPSFFNLATALENQGKNVDAALVWDQGHGLSRDLDGFFAFADELLDDAQTDKEYTITLDANGGTVSSDSLVTENGKLAILPTPTRNGYQFDGWYTAKSGGTEITEDTVFEADTTVYAHWTYTGGGSSGGGGSSSSGYTITVEKDEDGTVNVSPTRADRGDTVTVTVIPDSGHELDELMVTDKNGNAIELIDKGNGKYTFVMPSGRVTVKASFVESGEQTSVLDMPFADVSTGTYYYDAVLWATGEDITTGTSATTFSPDMACTRAQVVTFLWRANGSPVLEGASNPFEDVRADSYYYNAVLWAVEEGITTGTSATTFAPDANCTRAQVATFLWRAEGSPAVSGGTSFTDVASGAYYADAVVWASNSGVTTGTSTTTFSPDAVCTRAQIVTFLYRVLAE